MSATLPYYRSDLAFIHDQGFGFHADRCAPGILGLLPPGGTVLELGCGSGLLTKHLVGAGYRVIATDASPAMLDLARRAVPRAEVRRLVLPDDEFPQVDAIVGVGHCLNYLADAGAVRRALSAAAAALRPGGVLAVDLCDRWYGAARRDAPDLVRITDDWAIITRFSAPTPDRFVRTMTTFVRDPADGRWRRDDEVHDNVLLDTALLPAMFDRLGLDAQVRPAFGQETLPDGLVVLVARRPGHPEM
jgi:SAM-dependent methyltransferase